MKKQPDIHVFGCSFSDLSFPQSVLELGVSDYKMWSEIIANDMGYSIKSQAKSGLSNNTILKLLSTTVFQEKDIIMIQLTHFSRFGLLDLNSNRFEIGTSTVSTLTEEQNYLSYTKDKFRLLFEFASEYSEENIRNNIFFLEKILERLEKEIFNIYIISLDDISEYISNDSKIHDYLIYNNLATKLNRHKKTWYTEFGIRNFDGTPENHPSVNGNFFISKIIQKKVRNEII